MAQFYTLEVAARVLGMSSEELKGKAQAREVRAFLDRGSWRFRVVDIDELARRRGLGSDFELRLSDLDLVLNEPDSKEREALDLSEFQLGVAKPDLGAEITFMRTSVNAAADLVDSPSFPPLDQAQLWGWIKQRLVTDHVRCPGAQGVSLQDELRRPDSPVRELLAEGFHRLIIIEASRGLNADGQFEFDPLFLGYLKSILFNDFGIEATEDYHPEQISQILKDEPRSLFCFLDASLIPEGDAQRLRSFTQELHRVLFCGAASRPSPSSQSSRKTGRIEIRVRSGSVVSGAMRSRLGPVFYVGRSRCCDILLSGRWPQHWRIGGKHAAFSVSGGVVSLCHLHRWKRTQVNGERLKGRRSLREGDEIRIGPVVLIMMRIDVPAELVVSEIVLISAIEWHVRGHE
jgi:hypothetical protein